MYRICKWLQGPLGEQSSIGPTLRRTGQSESPSRSLPVHKHTHTHTHTHTHIRKMYLGNKFAETCEGSTRSVGEPTLVTHSRPSRNKAAQVTTEMMERLDFRAWGKASSRLVVRTSEDHRQGPGLYNSTPKLVPGCHCGQTFSPIPANWESSPSVRSMTKNRRDHRGEIGSLERASGYTTKTSPKSAHTQTHDSGNK